MGDCETVAAETITDSKAMRTAQKLAIPKPTALSTAHRRRNCFSVDDMCARRMLSNNSLNLTSEPTTTCPHASITADMATRKENAKHNRTDSTPKWFEPT